MRLAARLLSAATGIVVLIVVATVATGWAPDRPASELAARWAPPPSQFVEIAGLSVHLRDEGDRSDPLPLVLLHGTSASLHTWDGWRDALATDRRIVRVDLPGFGLTGPVADGDYRVARYVEFVTALLDGLDIEQCVLGGNSFGGWIAWETALAQPARVRALVLVDAAGYPLESESVPVAFRLASVPGVSRLLEFVLPRSVVASSVRNTYGDPARVTPELVDRYYELALREGNRAALVRRFEAGRHAADPSRVRAIAVPTLVLWGGRDRLIPPRYGEQFANDVAGSHLVVFPGLGHVPQEEDPAATAAAVRDFLAGVGTPAVAAPEPEA